MGNLNSTLTDLVQFINQVDWIYSGKIVLSLIMLIGSGFALFVALNLHKWYQQLVQLEKMAVVGRDDAMFNFTALRARLAAAKERASDSRLPVEQLFRNAGQVLMFFLSKERSILQWGMLGMKVAKSALTYFKNK